MITATQAAGEKGSGGARIAQTVVLPFAQTQAIPKLTVKK
jgi:hypothetical protein